jgi:alpha-ketoglutarate-dependent taurine dioxygenase
VVLRHPESGRTCLYVNAEYTARFEGWTRTESLGRLRGTAPEMATSV